MAITLKINLKDENITGVMELDYIPGYKIAEEQRRKNEEERIANEIERENYFEDMQEKVGSGYFNGEPGPRGPAGPLGEPGYTPIKGVDYFDGQDGKDGAIQYTAGTNIEITENNVINCTASGGSDFSGDYNDLINKPTKLSQFLNDKSYIDRNYLVEYTEAYCTSKTQHTEDIDALAGALGELVEMIPTKTSQLENDSNFMVYNDATINRIVNDVLERIPTSEGVEY